MNEESGEHDEVDTPPSVDNDSSDLAKTHAGSGFSKLQGFP